MASKPISRKDMTQTVDGKVTREPQNEMSGRGRFFWWKKREEGQEDELAKEIAATILFMDKHDTAHATQLVVSTRLYGNSNAYNLVGSSLSRAASTSSGNMGGGRISFNLCASLTDTLTAQVAKNKITPMFITSGGIWGMQKKAELLNKFIEGVFYENKFNQKKTYAARDSCVWGDGFVHVHRTDDDRVGIERRLPHNFKVDAVECMVREKPSQLHFLDIVDRGVVEEMFSDEPEKIKYIQDCPQSSAQTIGSEGSAADLITIVESFHLRSGKKAKDGLRVITLPDIGKTLTKDKWDKDYFPYPRIQYSKRLLGY